MATSGSLRRPEVPLSLLLSVGGLVLSGCVHLPWSTEGSLRECYPAERRLIEAKVARSRGHPTAAEAINAALLVVYGRVIENGAPAADQDLLLVTADRRAEGVWTLHGTEVITSTDAEGIFDLGGFHPTGALITPLLKPSGIGSVVIANRYLEPGQAHCVIVRVPAGTAERLREGRLPTPTHVRTGPWRDPNR